MKKTTILLIDDSPGDARLFMDAIRTAYPDIEVTVMKSVPPDLKRAFDFDAVILDENLVGEHGLDVAKRLHEMGWLTLPVMLLTGMPEGSMEHAYAFVDSVAYKNNQASFLYKIHALLREVARIRQFKT